MFRKPNPHAIECDAGFSVEEVAYSKLAYRENDRKVTLTIEYLMGRPAIFILYLAEHECWDPPFDAVRISDDEWKRIGEHIREAYRSQGFEIEVYMPSSQQRESGRRMPPLPENSENSEN